MPTINFDRKEFLDMIQKGKDIEIDDDFLNDKINQMGTSLEELNDDELVIEIFPNRPDLLSLQGYVRAFKSFISDDLNKKLSKKEIVDKYRVNERLTEDYKIIIDKSVKSVRPYTACAIVKNLDLDDKKIKDVILVQEKLHVTFGKNREKIAIGIYPLDKIRLPIRYLAKDPKEIVFQPLGEGRKMNAIEILENTSKGREFAHLLKGKKRYPVFIDSNDQILSMPPIINSDVTGKIEETTTEVFIECSGFDLKSVIDGINILSCFFIDLNAEVYSIELNYPKEYFDDIKDFLKRRSKNNKEKEEMKNIVLSKDSSEGVIRVFTPDLEPKKMKLDLDYVKKYIGIDIKKEDIKGSLKKMNLYYDENESIVLIPRYRVDVLHQIDIVEDVAIGYGYDNISSSFNHVFTIAEESSKEKFYKKLRETFIANEFIEVKNYHLNSIENETVNINNKRSPVILKNSLTQEFSVLRMSLISSLLKTLSKNKHNEYPQRIFEIGTVFIPKNDKNKSSYKEKIVEEDRLSCLICDKDSNYTKIKQVLLNFARDFKLSLVFDEPNYKKNPEDSLFCVDSFVKGRVANVFLKKSNDKIEHIGIVGEVNPEVIINFDLDMPVSLFEIKLKSLIDLFK